MRVERGWGMATVAALLVACGAFDAAGDGASTSDSVDAGAGGDAGGGGGEGGAGANGGGTITCGLDGAIQICAPGERCCTTSTNGDITAVACAAECPGQGLSCDDRTDCPDGQICCADTNGGGYDWYASACQIGPCTGSDRQLCKDSSECESGRACKATPQSLRPSGLQTCGL